MTTVAIVVALVVVVAAVALFLLRGKTASQLQAPSAGSQHAFEPQRVPLRPGVGKQKESARPPPPPARTSPAPHPAEDRAPEPKSGRGLAAPTATARTRRDVAGLRKGLAATRGGFVAKLTALFQGKKEIDPLLMEQVEEVMLSSDVGPKTTSAILARLRESVDRGRLRDSDAVWAALRTEAIRILAIGGGSIRMSATPTVVLMVGVNGAGKTTTIGKLATHYIAAGKKVVLAAGDTFRAAAVQQLEAWGKRVSAGVIKGKDGADPGAVAFDATTLARESGADLLLVDTAGRLHTKVPLMDEIKKVQKTIAKAMEGAPHETLLVLDATTGQNALTQAAMFTEALELTGIVLTKLDGTAKGGIVLGICDELKVPVRYIGLGERAEDLREFDAEEFVEALFGKGDEEVVAA
ncbi:MAG: signal recognition particle-docking protein FtsY [Myxococcota bacterium]|nr:signal recognition particle-docking protein FtsY [Myxococcota bacterium]